MTPKDFHPHARQIRFVGAHCDEVRQRFAQHFGTQGCTDAEPCGFHRTIAEALAAAYKEGRASASLGEPATS
jgi:hypothetical protein